MKKLICLGLAFLMVLSLSSCFLLAKEEAEDTTADTAGLPSYVGQEIKEFDENGDLILTSSDNRLVYPYEDGYVVFECFGETISKIQRVYVFEDADAAQEYIKEQTFAAVDKGEVPPNYTQNGKYAIITVGFTTDQTSLGFYYARSKTVVKNDFSDNGDTSI